MAGVLNFKKEAITMKLNAAVKKFKCAGNFNVPVRER
jgi:hypothetical protein